MIVMFLLEGWEWDTDTSVWPILPQVGDHIDVDIECGCEDLHEVIVEKRSFGTLGKDDNAPQGLIAIHLAFTEPSTSACVLRERMAAL